MGILQCPDWFVKRRHIERCGTIDCDREEVRSLLEQVVQILPQAYQQALRAWGDAPIEELRLRAGQVPSVVMDRRERPLAAQAGTVPVTPEMLQRVLMAACRQSQYAVQEQLREGFLTIAGGVRIGVCGSAVVQGGRVAGIREVSSLAIRIPREIRHPPQLLRPYLDSSCLLAGAPGSGKTTLLRSCIRVLSEAGQRVAVVDERLELAGAAGGVSAFDLGPCTDVLSGCKKAEGMLMLLRGMNPDWIAVDEITQPEDLAAIRQLAGCGVRLLATIHAGSRGELEQKPLCRAMCAAGVFRRLLILDRNRTFHAERIRYAQNDRNDTDSYGLRDSGLWDGADRPPPAGADRCAD